MERDGRMVGHVKVERCYQRRAEGAACLVTSLLVEEESRGKGYGRLLMEAAEDYARSEGIP